MKTTVEFYGIHDGIKYWCVDSERHTYITKDIKKVRTIAMCLYLGRELTKEQFDALNVK